MDGGVKEKKEGRKGQEEKKQQEIKQTQLQLTFAMLADFVCNFQYLCSLTTVPLSILIFNDFKRSSKVDKHPLMQQMFSMASSEYLFQ